jgi:hypothetical protein
MMDVVVSLFQLYDVCNPKTDSSSDSPVLLTDARPSPSPSVTQMRPAECTSDLLGTDTQTPPEHEPRIPAGSLVRQEVRLSHLLNSLRVL